MKKILILFVILCSHSIYSQDLGFTNITISPLTTSIINVDVKAITNCGAYFSYDYSINGSVINLNICYVFCGGAVIVDLENNFEINIPTIGNYSLNVIAYMTTDSTICNYANIQDSASLSFALPLNENISLSTKDIPNLKENFLFPNPTTGLLNIHYSEGSVSIYDYLGQKIKQYDDLRKNNIDISEFNNGIYLLEFKNLNERIVKKIILRK